MATIAYSAVRQKFRDALLGIADWKESRLHYDSFPNDDTRQLQHQVFAVGLVASLPEALDVRQSLTKGVETYTTVAVKVGSRLKADDEPDDGDLALDGELAAIAAIMAISPLGGLHIRFDGVIARTSRLGLHVSELRFRAKHRTALM